MAKVTKKQQEAIEKLQQALSHMINYCFSVDNIDSTKINYVLDGNGLFDVRFEEIGKFTTCLSNVEVPGLSKNLVEGFEPAFPKIPYIIYEDLVNFYRFIYDRMGSEVGVFIYYDQENNKFLYCVPEQKVNAAKCHPRYDCDIVKEYDEKYLRILETHSHHNMMGSFSGGDDEDHNDHKVLHMVIGNIFNNEPSYEIRYALGSHKVNIDIDTIFEPPPANETLDLIQFGDWKTNIKEKKYVSSNIEDNKNNNSVIINWKDKVKEPINDPEDVPHHGFVDPEWKEFERNTCP